MSIAKCVSLNPGISTFLSKVDLFLLDVIFKEFKSILLRSTVAEAIASDAPPKSSESFLDLCNW